MTSTGQSLRTIRSWDGSQSRAFEELCCQLRDPTPDGATLTKLGNPDAGYEWYVRFDSNGVERGWQAKYSFDFETLRGLMEDSLKTVVDKRPNCRLLTFCIPIDLPDARQGNERKSARQKFDDWKLSVRERIEGASRIRIELWQAGDLLERLAAPAHRGRAWFFWDQEVFGPDWCRSRLEVTTELAGERYTPEVNVELPIAFALEGLGRSAQFLERYRYRRGAFLKAARRLPAARHSGLGVTEALRELRRDVERATVTLPAEGLADGRFGRAEMADALRAIRERLSTVHPDQADELAERRRSLQHDLGALRRRLAELLDFLGNPASHAAEARALLVTGEAGQGKTHLFCDGGDRAVVSGRPVVVLLAGRFTGTKVFTDLAENLGVPARGATELLGAMAAAGEATGVPFLLLIDALNDSGDASGWREELPALLAEAGLHAPWIAIGVSVRSTYRSEIESAALAALPEVEHPGFAGFEAEAAQRYFAWHGLEQPRVPLMLPEFSNPLFLSLYCEALAEGTVEPPENGHVHVSEVFDTYLAAKNRRVCQTLRLDPHAGPVNAAIESFASAVAGRDAEWLPYEEAKGVVDAHAPHLHAWPNTLFGQLLAEGLLRADRAYRLHEDGDWEQVHSVEITFQRLADYRIATSLLAPCSTADDLRRSLAAGQELRRTILAARAGVVEALAVLVPERFGVELLDTARLNLRGSIRHDWHAATLASLSTRRDSAVTGATAELLAKLSGESRALNEQALQELLVVAARPGHALNAEFLHRVLAGRPLPDRDATWGIATYDSMSEPGPLDRLVRWAAAGPYPQYDERVIELACIPLFWLLSSPNRMMRDYVTKVLCQLLAPRLALMRRLVDRFVSVDDPYVLERVAVIAHGTLLIGGRDDPQAAVACARRLTEVVLDPDTLPHILVRDAARGAMEWCAAEGLITAEEYAQSRPPYSSDPPARPRTVKQLGRAYDRHARNGAASPYGTLFHSIFGLGDFGRYVIESDVRHFSRYVRSRPLPPVRAGRKPEPDFARTAQILQDVDPERLKTLDAGDLPALFEALEPMQRYELGNALAPPRRVVQRSYDAELAQRWVFERVLSLGWSPERFAVFDTSYRRRRESAGRSGHKAERFGKKYQWIAVHELLARLADNFHMSDAHDGEPTEYDGPWLFYGRHVDPTLPPTPRIIGDDGVESFGPTFADDENEQTWWVPEGPHYSGEDPPVRAGWAERPADIPEMRPLVLRADDEGVQWVALQAYYNWDEHPLPDQEDDDRPQRDLWAYIFSWLVRRDDTARLYTTLSQRSLMGRWMPEGGDVTDAAYLPEMPWAAAANAYPPEWEAVTYRGEPDVSDLQVLPAWVGYLWEGSVWDCSIDDPVNITLPALSLFRAGELRWVPVGRTWQDASGATVARHVSTAAERRSVLLVRDDWLRKTLRALECSLVIGLLGEKRLRAAGVMGGLEGSWSEVTGVAKLHGDRWTFGRGRITVHQPARRA